MLHLVDEALESLLRAEVPSLRDAEVSFDVPDDTWRAGVTKPTVDVFLYDVRRDAERQQSGWTIEENGEGRVRRQPIHYVDCRYLVTVWTAEIADQHHLLGALLAALLDVRPIPEQHRTGPLADLELPPMVSAAWPTEREPFEFWNALGGQLRPGIQLTVTLPIDRQTMVDVGPPVERVTDRLSPLGQPGEASERVGGRATGSPEGSRVWTPRGAGRVDGDGSLLVSAAPGDPAWVAEPPREGVVPEHGVIELDDSEDDAP